MKTSVLFVDDKPRMLKIVASALPEDQYELCFALNIDDAMEKLREKAPYFLLLDASFPMGDPWKVVRYARTALQLSEIKIIFFVSHFTKFAPGEKEKYNISAILTKPFTPEDLRKKLLSLQEDSARQRSLHADTILEKESVPDEEVVELKKEDLELEETVEELIPPSFSEEEDTPTEKIHLDSFFENEIDTKEVESSPLPPPTPIDSPLQEDFKEELKPALEKEEEVYLIEEADALEEKDLEKWIENEPKTVESPRKPLLEKDQSSKDSFFDTGNSNFSFSKDYIDKIGKQVKQYKGIRDEPSVPEEVATKEFLSIKQQEEIFSNEAQKLCRKLVEEMASNMIPEITERIVREKLNRVLSSIEKEELS